MGIFSCSRKIDMYLIALKMLVGDKAKYFGILLGVTFACLIMTQQPSIFTGLMTRTYSFVTQTSQAEIWVVDPKVQFSEDIKPLQDTQLYRVRGVEGVEWAMPIYRGNIRARLDNGTFQNTIVVGIDDTTLIGGPSEFASGSLEDLRKSDSIIVDVDAANSRLAKRLPDGTRIPLKVGDTLELNDKRAVVVGIAKISRPFNTTPIIYTTYTRATSYAPNERKLLSFIIAKAKEGYDPKKVTEIIEERTSLAAHTAQEFKMLTLNFFLRNTGIPINFGISVMLGFIVGLAIAGQTFYSFTLENLKQFGALKAMGTKNSTLLKMVLFQALVVGLIGYGLGTGITAFFGHSMTGSPLAFKMTWQLLVFSASGVTLICFFSAIISLIKVIRLEPAVVFK